MRLVFSLREIGINRVTAPYSFLKTGKLWWADGGSLSPQGVIYSTIDGQGGGMPIAVVDNASRVIKYVVILGYRYQSYSLVDMRVHDVNVVADLNRHEPNNPEPSEPEEYDGSTPQNLEAEPGIEVLWETIANGVSTTWRLVNYWPRLFLTFVNSINGKAEVDVELSTDILGDLQIHRMRVASVDEKGMSDVELESVTQQAYTTYQDLVVRFAVPLALVTLLRFTMLGLEALASPLALVTSLGTLLMMLGAWVVLFLSYVAYMIWLVDNTLTHPWAAMVAFLGLLMSMFPGIVTAARNGWRLFNLWSEYRPLGGPGTANTNKGIWFVAVFLVKLSVILICAYYAAYFFNLGFNVPLKR
ncbi:MAG: hypothetical protein HXY34_08560 [Candidatus Thorarchaeota archaeon]|nr:hypothetical protein [Candidatus Thorarchaeota archaeon]